MQNKYLMVQLWYNKRTYKAQNKQIKTDKIQKRIL
uniref:Uncharacterized protein n=1 Tax=virus sp. ctn3M15 TaxID=2825821 RepID=A0A8S5RL90_9VIRU|nr:MAG TPA: hypothetical protein [virus sp. ctn3M15]